jgi:hypothetical protein
MCGDRAAGRHQDAFPNSLFRCLQLSTSIADIIRTLIFGRFLV